MLYKFNPPTTPVDIVIFAGHGNSDAGFGFDPGAVSNGVNESTITQYLALEVATRLDKAGLNVFYDEQNFKDKDLKGVNLSSKWALSFHINAGGGTGTEILVPAKEPHLQAETNILNRLASLGYKSRGLKSRNYDTGATVSRVSGKVENFKDYYGEIRDAWERGISLSIVEFMFLDTIPDLVLFRDTHAKVIDIMVNEIYNEVRGTSIPTTPSPTPTPTQKSTYIQLAAHESSWRIYNVNGPYTVGHEVGKLAPSKFGGLEYKVNRWISENRIAEITTQQFGKVAIYVGIETGAKIVTK